MCFSLFETALRGGVRERVGESGRVGMWGSGEVGKLGSWKVLSRNEIRLAKAWKI